MGYFRSFSLLVSHNFATDKNLIIMKKYLSLNFRADWFEAMRRFPKTGSSMPIAPSCVMPFMAKYLQTRR